jgi:hypothetical protein
MTMIEEAPRPEWAEINARQSFNIGEQVKDLRRMVQEEIDSRAEVERFVDASREREHRLRKAIAALEGVPLGAGGRPKARRSGAGWCCCASSSASAWQASRARVRPRRASTH